MQSLQQQGIYVHGAKVIQSPTHGGLIPTHGGLSPLHGANGLAGLGPELVLNGSFLANTANWGTLGTGTIAWDPSGQLKFTTDGSAGAAAAQSIAAVVGARYYFAATMAPGNTADKARITLSGFGEILNWDTLGANIAGIITATVTTPQIQLGVANTNAWGVLNDFALFDNVSIRKVV